MNGFVRQQLRAIVARHGISICEDPLRCQGLLRDACYQYPREVNLIVAALQGGVPQGILSSTNQIPLVSLMSRLSVRLEEEFSFPADKAAWAVRSWAIALGAIAEEDETIEEVSEAQNLSSRASGQARWMTADLRLRRIGAPAAPITAFALNGKVRSVAVAVGQGRSVISIWNSTTGQESRRFPVTKWRKLVATCLSFKRDGRLLAAGLNSGQILVWDLRNGVTLFRETGHERGATVVAFHPYHSRLASAGTDGYVRLWDVDNKKMVLRLPGVGAAVVAIALSPTGTLLASCSQELAPPRLWEVERGREIVGRLKGPIDSTCSGLCFSADGGLLAGAANRKGQIAVWEVDSGQLRMLDAPRVTSLAFHGKERVLAAGCDDGTIYIWDLQSDSEPRSFIDRPEGVHFLAFGEDGNTLAASGIGPGINIWNVR